MSTLNACVCFLNLVAVKRKSCRIVSAFNKIYFQECPFTIFTARYKTAYISVDKDSGLYIA